ncbi:MAG: folate-binding protein YgfZ [Fibrella sp.]|nr:folate-binding protein YgfZ [Armatimonadota bacterium]
MLPELFYTPTKRDLLKLTGKDRQSFLQGMVTNDVLRLQPGEGCYAFMLDATAHVLADMRVLNIGEYLLLDLESGMAPFVAETLDKYLIMEKCRITDVTSDFATFIVGGAGAADSVLVWFEAEAHDWVDGNNAARALGAGIFGATARVDAVAAKWTTGSVPTFSLYAQSTEPGQIIEILNDVVDTELPEDTLDALRIEAGIPRFGVDMDKTVLAPEVRQDARAVSYKKGCYIGQEIVARIDARGHTNKGLVGFFLDPAQSTLPENNAPVFASDGKQVGRITSAALSPTLGVPIALGYLRNEHAAPTTPLTVGSPDGTAIQIAALPFVGTNQ